MSTSVFANTDLTEEAWRWQGGTVNTDDVASNGAVVDQEGNLFLVGMVHKVYRDGELEAADFGVYKLDGVSGDVLWEWIEGGGSSTYNLGLAAAVDGDGNLIMGGSSTGVWKTSFSNTDEGSDLAAVKLDGESGGELWRYQNTFVASTTDYGSTFIPYGTFVDMASDSAGDILFVGYVTGTWKTGEGDAYDDDFIVGKLDGSTGEEIWSLQGGPAGSTDWLQACTVDSQDNLIVAGYSHGDITESSTSTTTPSSYADADHLVMKFNNDGDKLWAWQGGSALDDILYTVAVDSSDNIYVAGGEQLDANWTYVDHAVVMKLDGSSGTLIWEQSHTPKDATGCFPFYCIAVDDLTGTVVAAGRTHGVWVEGGTNAGYSDFAAIAMDMTTGEAFGRWQDGTGDYDVVEGVVFDSDGSLFVAGYSAGTWSEGDAEGDYDYAVVKFSKHATGSDSNVRQIVTIAAIAAGVALVVILAFVGYFCCRRRHRQPGGNGGAGSVDEVPDVSSRQYPVAAKIPSQEAHGGGNTTHPPAFGHAIYDVPRSQHEQRNNHVEGNTTVEDLPEELPPPYTEVIIAVPDDDRPTPEGPPPRYKSVKNLFSSR